MPDIATTDILDGALASPTARGFVEDVLEAFGGAETEYARAAAMGGEFHAAGGNDPVELWRELARLGHAIDDAMAPRCSDPAERRRLRVIVDEATGKALEGFGAALGARRDRWLSYFSHEMRNSLNTLVNAHWIIRNGEGKPTAKICDMSDRAVRKLEELVKGFRELEVQVLKPPPSRDQPKPAS